MQKYILAATTGLIIIAVAMVAILRSAERPDIRGTWTSVACEALEPGDRTLYMIRSYDISSGEWKLSSTLYFDKDCTRKHSTLTVEGQYEIGDKAIISDNVFHAQFDIASIKMAPHTSDLVQVFEQTKCGDGTWAIDELAEIGTTGCIDVGFKISECPRLYDLVKRENDLLTFADKSQDICSPGIWPDMLDKYQLKKSQ